ncbi:aminoglycoside phosphotransferase family protein [Paenibacillus sp. JX-17]|uniref:Aminoglycoside phosphotransferase family protein n=1 Tax=Paenibacillus lacisoli TaxID=3064525 RepID=A0ABT9CDV3_9BACL|nr:aminoglycoside phosphotransferase family protein [Paenibacillus sp. JX-17]MDO7907459.1 aminoglycoside phosphotransferase family protein [Paenibacillus sp. JX-17]
MESANKTRLSPEQINEIVHTALNHSVRSAVELADGWANNAYSIELDTGERVVLKIAPPADVRLMRYEQHIMKAEVAALERAGELKGMPVPKVLIHDDTFSLAPAEYFMMEYVEGTPYNKAKPHLSKSEQDVIEEQIGQLNRLLNAVEGTRFGTFLESGQQKDTWREAFTLMIENVLQDGRDAGVELPVDDEVIEQEIQRRLPYLDEVQVPQLVHWDLWDGNIFVQNGQVTGLIDFERTIWGDPLIEYYFGKFAGSDAFLKGYGRPVLTKSEQQRRALYNLYLDLILVIESTYRGYTDQNHVSWTYENLKQGVAFLTADPRL